MSAGSGDGFVPCVDGQQRWGRHGAAGVLFVHVEADGPHVLLQKRSAWSHQGGTWAVPGGALDRGESPLEGALREASEEIGTVPEVTEVGRLVFDPGLAVGMDEDEVEGVLALLRERYGAGLVRWTYTTLVLQVPHRFGVAANFESDAVGWFRPAEVDAMDGRGELHAGFSSSWPALRALLR